MGERILHECGLAVVRLRKELSWYRERYADPLWGLHRLFLLMEKQHNRGQDGAGLGCIKLNVKPGQRYISRVRSNGQQPIQDIFKKINEELLILGKSEIDWTI